MAKEILLKEPARSLKEFRLLPGKTTLETIMDEINLKTKLCKLPNSSDFMCLNIPLMNAAMQALIGYKQDENEPPRYQLAVAIPQHGGLGVIPRSIPIEDGVDIVKKVKNTQGGFQENVLTVSPDDTIEKIIKLRKQHRTLFVTENGESHGRFLGIIGANDYDLREHVNCLVKDRMRSVDRGEIVFAQKGIDLDQATDIMVNKGVGKLPILDNGNLSAVVFREDRDRHIVEFPNELINGKTKKYVVGAAISTREDDRERIDVLLEKDVDVLFIDSSDGFSTFQIDTLLYVKEKSENIPIICGNIVTSEAFDFLIKETFEKYGICFDAVKVGMGIGSACTTQEEIGLGRGQATALMDVVKARDEFAEKYNIYIPVISDGGIVNAGEIAVALSFGADSVMLGRYFARFDESAGNKREIAGEIMKEYWMEASEKAKNFPRYGVTEKTFFPEGEEGYVPYVGSIHEKKNLPETINKIKASLSHAGCRNIEGLHKYSRLELQSEIALKDAGIHGVILK